MPIPYADNFLAGSILTLVLPVGLLIAIATWYVLSIRRIPGREPEPVPGSEAIPPYPPLPAASGGGDAEPPE